MKSFGIRLIPYVLGVALFWLLGWYQTHFQAPEGDLVRVGFLITDRHYPDPEPLAKVRDTSSCDILLVGDSHLDQSPTSRRFQNHLNLEVSAHSHFAYEDHNPFSLGMALALQQSPELVVFQVTERTLIYFARRFLQKKDAITAPRIAPHPQKQESSGFSHLGNGLRTAASFFDIRLNWCLNHRCKVVPCTSRCPLYSNDKIFLIKEVWRRPPPREVWPILKKLKEDLSNRLGPQGTDFLIYVIPDKATVYSDFFDATDLPPSFLLESPWPADVYSPIHEMREAVHSGTMEVFKYSDTHLAEAGAKITGQHLTEVLQQWTEGPSH